MAKFLSLWGAAVALAVAARPNFVFVLTDDQDVLLGSLDGMPTAQRIMRDGRRYDHAFVDTPICCPSRTSTLSGLYGHNLEQGTNGWCGAFTGFPLENRTWVTALHTAGYRVGYSGKYHNSPPTKYMPQGYDDFFSLINECQYFSNAFTDCTSTSPCKTVQFGTNASDYMTSLIGNRSMAFLRDAVSGDAPFMAFIAPHASHMPATPAPWYVNAPVPTQRAPRNPAYNASGKDSGKHWVISELAPLNDAFEKGIDLIHRDRARTLLSVDDILREVLELLTSSGKLSDTFIMYGADHGYNLGAFRLSVEKFHHLENDINVPFFVSGPGVAPNSTSVALVSNIDIGATILDLAGVAPTHTDGRSFAADLLGGTPPTRDRLLIEYGLWGTGYVSRGPCSNGCGICPEPTMQLLDAPSNTYSGLRIINASHDWSYFEFRPSGDSPITHASTNWTELYDMRADPFQLFNLALTAAPATLKALSEELFTVATCSGAECP
jgi:N-acetylglucosamine-6-sulfatase